MKTISEAIKPNLGGAGFARPVVGVEWTPELKRVLKLHPLAIRSNKWRDIAALANAGDVDAAMQLARSTEKGPDIQFRATLTRRSRIARMPWFSRVAKGDRELRDIFTRFGDRIEPYLEKNASNPANLGRINAKIKEMATELRAELRAWLNALIRDTTRIGLKSKGEALLPIFKNSREAWEESFGDTLEGVIEMLEAEVPIAVGSTAALTLAGAAAKRAKDPKPFKVSITKRLNVNDPRVKMAAIKWKAAQRRVLKTVLKKNITGQNPSTRIWELVANMEQTMRRNVATGVMRGRAATKIARDIKKFTSPQKIAAAFDEGRGTGIYKSPFKNAMRVARTETNRAYAKASGEFAKAKPWIVGKQFNLSGAHKVSDECDSWDGVVVSVDEYNEMVDDGRFPFHPQCMCYDTDVIDDKYLEKEAA